MTTTATETLLRSQIAYMRRALEVALPYVEASRDGVLLSFCQLDPDCEPILDTFPVERLPQLQAEEDAVALVSDAIERAAILSEAEQ
mgnify:CR=1 FL=1